MFFFKHLILILCIVLLLLCMLVPLKKEGIFPKLLSYHKTYAILLAVFSLLHGILAGHNAGMTSGMIAWLIMLVLILSAYLINRDSMIWNKIHLFLSFILVFAVIYHIFYVYSI